MASESALDTVYCTDEDISVRCYGDFAALVPKDQVLAAGSDGAFASSDLWTLTSASNDFAAQGVNVGHVVQITGPSPFKGGGTQFAVGVVSGNSLTLRRRGEADGVGMPPAPTGGLSNVAFAILTFDPQIEIASYDLNQKFGIDPGWELASPNLIYDLRVLRQATALTVIHNAYAFDARSEKGDWAVKRGITRQALSDQIAILQIRWNQATDTPPPTSLFSTRLTR